jgi:hypothetical protein
MVDFLMLRDITRRYISLRTPLLSSGTSYLSFSFLSVDWSDDERVQFKNEILNSVQAIG